MSKIDTIIIDDCNSNNIINQFRIDIIKLVNKSQTHKCYCLNQKNEPCPWNSVSDDSLFCKRHSIYEGVFTKEDIPKLSRCSGCKNFIKENLDTELKQCVKCYKRSELNRKKVKEVKLKIIKICKGFTQKNTQCAFEANFNDDYCQKHQTYKKWKELSDSGKIICKNWIRGCFEQLNKMNCICVKCREKEKNNENANNQIKKESAIKFNLINTETKMCLNCNSIDIVKNITNNKCLKCYNSYHRFETNRNKPDSLIYKLYKTKKGAYNRNIEWNLTDDVAKNFFKEKCNYCNKLVGFNGIDRIDSNKPYELSNCASCCKYCNIMKNTYSAKDFINLITYILAINFYIDEIPNINIIPLFKFGNITTYSKFTYECKERKINNEISEIIYNNIIIKPCTYCKNQFINGARGIDRIDSTIGYIVGNITPCCYTCNTMKNILSQTEFFEHLNLIYNYKVKGIINLDLTLKEKIISLCKNIKPFPHEKFYYNSEYYENLVYKENNIDAIKKILIELEFVENDKQKDIWNYYRRHVSSLKKFNNAKLVGRQIYILVKDSITMKYLGILSLSSDIYCLDNRDKYIGWSYQDKKTKLNYIMNMSTCVPLQPFGFNFNGGKLLATLIFSKQVIEYFQNKYNEPLLGICTTSLYGKSIQYARLKHLKFVGFTKGNSVQSIPSDVTKLCNQYLKSEYGYNYNLTKKFIILQKTFDELNIPKEDILTSNPKGIYFGFTCSDSKDYLIGKTDKMPILSEYNLHSIDRIFRWWVKRWATHRFVHLTNTNKLKIY